MKKILTIIGARPQFIKACVVSSALKATGVLDEVVVHTGQHYDQNMSQVFFSEFGMQPPKHNLGICGGTHGAMTGNMLVELERVMLEEKPDIALVYGDTNSTLAGALAASKLHIPVAHVESGLRSFNMKMPEEINRILTDRISRWLFTPTETASSNLHREGMADKNIFLVGDVMYDVALHHGKRVNSEGGLLEKLGLKSRSYVLATIHRAENTDNPMRLNTIIDALKDLSRDIPVIWPMHPRTRKTVELDGQLTRLSDQIHVINPVGYLEMVQLEKYAALIATDSGGVQKEAFFHRVPCVTLRYDTEWVELVESGWNFLAPPVNSNLVLSAMRMSIGKKGKDIEPYGTGQTATLIASKLSIGAS